jgi:two-component system response regulator MprA
MQSQVVTGRDDPLIMPRRVIPSEFKIGLVVCDGRRRELRSRHTAVSFTKTEFALLSVLAAQPGRLLTRQYLQDTVWGSGPAVSLRTIDAHIGHIRKKLLKLKMDPDSVPVIQTVWGLGYKLRESRPE